MASIVSAGTTSATALNMSADTSGVLQLASNNGTVGLTMDTSQNVGIGTTSPTGKVQITGASGSRYLTLDAPTNGGYVTFQVGGTAFGDLGSQLGMIGTGSATDLFLTTRSTNNLAFGTNNTERMRIDSSGNILNGVTAIGSSNPGMYIQNNQATSTGYNIINTNTSGSATFFAGSAFSGGTYCSFGWNGSAVASGSYVYSNPNVTFLSGGGNNNLQIGTSGSGNIKFYNGATQTATLTSANGLLVGLTSAWTSTVDNEFRAASGTNNWSLNPNGTNTGTDNFLLITTGKTGSTATQLIRAEVNHTGLGGSSVTYRFGVDGAGNIYATNTSVQSTSDIRLKENIRDSEDGLNIIDALKVRRFDWKEGFGDGKKNVLGFIAQEIEQVFPEAVGLMSRNTDVSEEDDPKYKTVGPGALIPVLVKAIQELNAKVTALENK